MPGEAERDSSREQAGHLPQHDDVILAIALAWIFDDDMNEVIHWQWGPVYTDFGHDQGLQPEAAEIGFRGRRWSSLAGVVPEDKGGRQGREGVGCTDDRRLPAARREYQRKTTA